MRDGIDVEPIDAVHHVALTVRDLDRSVAWYRDVIGCEELFREDGDGRRACVMRFANGRHAAIGFVEWTPGGAGFDPHNVGLDHLAFTVASEADMDEWAERLTNAGIEHSGAIDVPPGKILNFKDPDGIALSLFWDR